MKALTRAPGAGGGSFGEGEVPPRRAPRQRFKKLVAALAAIAAALPGSVVLAEPAQAYSGPAYIGYGLGGINNDQDYFVGTVSVGGVLVFCIDPGSGSPFGGSYNQGSNTDFGWSPDKVARVNYVASTYHNTTDDNLAASAQFAIWQLINPFGWNMHGYSGSNFRDAVYYALQQKGYLPGLGGFATWRLNQVADNAVAIFNQAQSVHAGTSTTTYVTGDPTASTGDLDIDATITQSGHTQQFLVTIGDGIESGGSTGTLSLTNATFDSSGTATLTGVIHSGDVYAVTANHGGPVEIAVHGSTETEIVTTSTTTSTTTQQMWLPLVTALYNTDGARQNLSYGAGTASYQVTVITSVTNTETRTYHFGASVDATIWFAPKVTTEVESEFVEEGDRLTDTLTPVLFPGSPAWGMNAASTAWLPVIFNADIYRTDGPVADGQPIPDDAELGAYPWTDDARVSETSVAPFQPTAVSATSERLAEPGDALSDQLTVSSANGLWLELDGAPIPVTFTGTAYAVAGVLPPVQGSGIPSSATALGTVQLTATGKDNPCSTTLTRSSTRHPP